MSKGRLEAFSDGVLAIVITIMVLDLVPPEGASFRDLLDLAPVFLSYVLSFANIAIWWNNHHHLFQAVRVVDGRVLWANMLLLFSLSLLPFATAWMGEHSFAGPTVSLYGIVLLSAALAYFLLVRALIAIQPGDAPLAAAIGNDAKGKISPLLYAIAILTALVVPWVSMALYVTVSLIWIVPDTRIERRIGR